MNLTTNSFETLPKDILFNILLESDYATIKRLCSTNKAVNAICQDNYFWFLKYKHDFNFDLDEKAKLDWRKAYKYDYARKYPLNGYQVKIGSIFIVVIVRNQNEIYEMLTQIYNDDHLYNDNDRQIRENLISLVNNSIIEQNKEKIYEYRGLIIQNLKNYLTSNSLICLHHSLDIIYEWIERYYFTPNLLFNKFKNNTEAACYIYDIVKIFIYLYNRGTLRQLFQEAPRFNDLLEYYSQYKTIRGGYRNPDSLADINEKYIQQITVDQLKTILLNSDRPGSLSNHSITPINIYKL